MGNEEEAYFTFVRESDNPFHQRTAFVSVEDLINSLLNKNQLRRPFALATKTFVNGNVYPFLHYQRMMLAIGSILFESPVEFMELIHHEVTVIHLLPVVQQNIVSPCPKVSFNKILEVHRRFPQHIKHALACQGEGFLVTFYTTGI